MRSLLKKPSILFLAIIIVIANFVFVNSALAKKIKISDKEIDRIKFGLDLAKTFSNIVVSNDAIRTALNLAFKGGEAGADVTYGLLVLSAMNEMELIDMVVSQRYKKEASAYFEKIVDERTSLVSYWKGVGFDIPRVVSGKITGPMAGLTLNTFSITEKTISILTAFNVLAEEKRYDGLWYYFDLRRENNESHQEAWEQAKIVMGWAAYSVGGFYRENQRKADIIQLESQFAELWDKWSPYTDSFGVKKEYKEKFQQEMGELVSEAVKEQSLAKKEPSFFEKTKSGLADSMAALKQALATAKDFVQNAGSDIQNVGKEFFSDIKSFIQRSSPFGAEVSQTLPSLAELEEENLEEAEIKFEQGFIQETEKPKPLDLVELQENFDDIFERLDVLGQETNKLVEASKPIQPGNETKKEAKTDGELNNAEKPETTSQKSDEKPKEGKKEETVRAEQKKNTSELIPIFTTGWISAPATKLSYPKILISELQIASQSTEKDDFVELYNPNSKDLDLTDWYLQRKTKGTDDFSTYVPKSLLKGRKISANSYFLITNASSSFSGIADAATIYPLTEDNVLVLKNPNGDVVDKAGWGEARDFETSPAQNPSEDKSIGRKWSTATESYTDSDNNSADFAIQSPTPKSRNQSPLPENLNQLPQASFAFSPLFPFVGEEVLFDASSSTDPDGKIVSYVWDFGDSNSTTTLFATTTFVFAAAGDFLAQLSVQDDKAGTSAATATLKISAKPKPAENIVVSEVQIKDKEFIELYNPSEQSFPLEGKYLSYFSQNDDWSNPQRNWQIPATAAIPGKSFYLIGIYDYSETSGNPNSDWQVLTKTGSLYSSGQMSNQAGAVGIFSCDPSASSTEAALACKIDAFSWQEGNNSALVFEGSPYSFEEEIENKSFHRKKDESGFYIDENNNAADFEIGALSPENSKGEKQDILPPDLVSDFEIDEDNSANNKVSLVWSAVQDPDTLPEKISYKIYYSKEELEEDNLENEAVFSTSTFENSILISGLSYNSAYYFGVMAFDGRHYSALSEIVSFEIPSALANSPWPMLQQNFQRNSQSAYSGPSATPTLIWKYTQESDFQNPSYNPYYTSPVIDPEGIIYTSVIYPDSKEGILVLNPDGTKKEFLQKDIGFPLALQPDGSVLEDDRKTKDKDGNVYAKENNILKAIDEEGQVKWQKEIPFPNLENYTNYSSYGFSLGNPVISPEGKILLTAEGRIYPSGDNTTYLYLFAISPESGEIIWTHTIYEGYRASSPTVSVDGNVYIFYIVYPRYAWQPTLYLRAISSAGNHLWSKSFGLYNVQPPVIDAYGNLYFAFNKERIYGFDKQGEQLWQYSLSEAYVPWNWYQADIGVVLSSGGALYLSGLGAVVALK